MDPPIFTCPLEEEQASQTSGRSSPPREERRESYVGEGTSWRMMPPLPTLLLPANERQHPIVSTKALRKINAPYLKVSLTNQSAPPLNATNPMASRVSVPLVSTPYAYRWGTLQARICKYTLLQHRTTICLTKGHQGVDITLRRH